MLFTIFSHVNTTKIKLVNHDNRPLQQHIDGRLTLLKTLVAIILGICVSSFLMKSSALSMDLNTKISLFIRAYAPYIKGRKEGVIVMKNGNKIIIDHHETTSFFEKLRNPDIKDMVLQNYPLKAPIIPPNKNSDPGRINNQKFLSSVYGSTRYAVEKNSKPIEWFGKTFLFNTRNGAWQALQKVKIALKKLPTSYLKYLRGSSGTFNYRFIAGTKRLSLHSFAIAIDINPHYSNYWKWTVPKTVKDPSKFTLKYKNRIPQRIVHIFEKYGFVWGGRWYHFDTMHFHYRPDLMSIARFKEK